MPRIHSTHVPAWVIVTLTLALPSSLHAQWLDGGVVLSNGSTGRFVGDVLPDGSGGAYVAWAQFQAGPDPSNPDAFAQHVRADGTLDPSWPAQGLQICDVGGRKYPSGLESDGTGGFIVVWYDYRNPSADSSGAYEIYANRITATGEIAAGWPVNGLRVSGVRADAARLLTCSDGEGGIFIAWRTSTLPVGEDDGIRIQRITVNGIIAPGWPADGIVGVNPPYGQFARALIADGLGGTYLLWDADLGGHSHAIRITSEGTVNPGWPDAGIDVSQEMSFGITGSALSDGGLIAFWAPVGSANPPDVLKATRLSAQGSVATGWPPTGVVVSTRGANQPLACTGTSDGGAAVAWARFESGEVAIYAQKVGPDGSIPAGWPPEGIAIFSSPEYSQEIGVASDENGGVYVSWENGQSVSALHLLASGVPAPGWPARGLSLSSSQAYAYGPAIAVAPPGGAIVAWTGFEDGPVQSSIRAQRLGPWGPESFSIGLVESDARSDRVRLRWRSRPQAELPVTAQRRTGVVAWQDLSILQPDALGNYLLEDSTVTPGETYEYRLSVSVVGRDLTFGDALVAVPRLQLAIRARTVQRSSRGLSVTIEVPEGEKARISLIDLHGRTLSTLYAVGPGLHPIQLQGNVRPSAGVYFVLLEQGGQRVRKRIVLLH